MLKWRDHIALCIEAGQQLKEITTASDANKLAEMFLDGWQGAVMRAKTTKCVEPLDAFIEIMFNHILKP